MLIAWEGLPDSEATWEDYDNFNKTFHLEDKVVLKGGGNDSARDNSRAPAGAVQSREFGPAPVELGQTREQVAHAGRDKAELEHASGQGSKLGRPRTRAYARASQAALAAQGLAEQA